jgi:hypothetical protein
LVALEYVEGLGTGFGSLRHSILLDVGQGWQGE